MRWPRLRLSMGIGTRGSSPAEMPRPEEFCLTPLSRAREVLVLRVIAVNLRLFKLA